MRFGLSGPEMSEMVDKTMARFLVVILAWLLPGCGGTITCSGALAVTDVSSGARIADAVVDFTTAGELPEETPDDTLDSRGRTFGSRSSEFLGNVIIVPYDVALPSVPFLYIPFTSGNTDRYWLVRVRAAGQESETLIIDAGVAEPTVATFQGLTVMGSRFAVEVVHLGCGSSE